MSARLRSIAIAAAALCLGMASGARALQVVSLAGPGAAVALGAPVDVEIRMSFDDPTLGGGVEIAYDATRLSFQSFAFDGALGDDPAFRLAPSDGSLEDPLIVAFGEFGGLGGARRVGVLRFVATGLGAASVQAGANVLPAGPFVSVTTFAAQDVEFEGTSIAIVPEPGTAWLLACGLGIGAALRRRARSAKLATLAVAALGVFPIAAPRAHAAPAPLALRFEEHRGEAPGAVRYVARGSAFTLHVLPGEAVVALAPPRRAPDAAPDLGAASPARPAALRMRFAGAEAAPALVAEEPLAARTHLFLGPDRARWRTDVPSFGRVRAVGVAPGADVVFYGRDGSVEYDVVLAPGAEVGAVRLRFDGVDRMALDPAGDLVLEVAGRSLRLRAPVAYQEAEAGRRAVESAFVLASPREVGFRVGAYDRARTLVIDPVLAYSSYFGGDQEDNGGGVHTDATGIWIGGLTVSSDLPTADPLFPSSAGGFDAFVAKLDPSGSALLWATYFGGSGDEIERDLAVDAAGNAYLFGETTSPDLPTTPGALDVDCGSDGACNGGIPDVFVTKLDPTGGTLLFSTYLGGSGSEIAGGIEAGADGMPVVAGYTNSADLPATPGSFDPACGADGACDGGLRDAFVAKLAADGESLVYATYLGGSSFDRSFDVALDAAGSAYVAGGTFSADFPATPSAFDTRCGSDGRCDAGDDAFVAKLSPDGSALAYATFLGGRGDGDAEIEELAWAIALDAAGNATVAGQTDSADFPAVSAARPDSGGGIDAFVAKLDPSGAALVYSTYLGGGRSDQAFDVAVDAFGNAHVTGATDSPDFPIVDALPEPGNTCAGCALGFTEAFVTKLDAPGASLLYSIFLGGTSSDYGSNLALTDARTALVLGDSYSFDFPTASAFQAAHGAGVNYDAFLARIEAADLDGDVVPDDTDNCAATANADQRDTDGDSFGNRCDADLDGSGFVNFVDLGLFRAAFFSADPDADFDGSGLVNFADLAIFRSLFFRPPGP
jgi:hypothetical protein